MCYNRIIKGKQKEKENKIMTKYNVVFKDGTERAYTSEQFKNRLDVNNYLITSGMAKEHKGIKSITCSAYVK